MSNKIKKMSPLLLVADLEKSIEFYTKELDFDVEFRYEDFYTGIIKDGYSIHLKVSRLSNEQKESRISNEDVHIIFSVGDVEHLFKELSDKSVTIIQSLRHMPYGKEFYVVDLDNNIIAFLQEKDSL